MAIEALLGTNPPFIHKPQHDLESILYIILYICTFVQGPGLPLHNPDILRLSLPICSWFNNDEIREIGYHKLAHLECYSTAILPNFTPYWDDFAPYVEDLINACFPAKASLPNELQYAQVLGILEKAYDAVGEPSNLTEQVSQALDVGGALRLKRPHSNSSLRGSKKGKRTSLFR
jgi:hypothetical protein